MVIAFRALSFACLLMGVYLLHPGPRKRSEVVGVAFRRLW